MTTKMHFDVVIIGGSFAGLSAALTLGRSLRQILVIDSRQPCNQQTPHAHNLLTHDGHSPQQIAQEAKAQVGHHKTVEFYDGLAVKGRRTTKGFAIETQLGDTFTAKKLIFATGVIDIMPDISGFEACWGISILHCPYCHGYEVRGKKTGILLNGEMAFELGKTIRNWTNELCIFTNGTSTLTSVQTELLASQNIKIIEKRIGSFVHKDGQLQSILFQDGTTTSVAALYAKPAFKQHSNIPAMLGCSTTEHGHVIVNEQQQTTEPGVYACGDTTTAARTLSFAIAAGTAAGINANKALTAELFGE
jgi:thioredoxin reductase